MQQQWIISQSDCDMRQVNFIWQPAVTSSVTGLRRSSKALPKAKLPPRKGHGHWWSASHLIHYSFLNPGETIVSEKYAQQIDEMHWKPQRLSQHWSTERAHSVVFSITPPAHTLHNQHFKSWINWGYKVLPHLPYSPAAAAKSLQLCPTPCDPTDCSPPGCPVPGILQARTLEWVAISFSWPLTNRPPHFQAARQFFAGKVLPQAAGCRKCFPRVCRILKHATGINKHFFLAKICWL